MQASLHFVNKFQIYVFGVFGVYLAAHGMPKWLVNHCRQRLTSEGSIIAITRLNSAHKSIRCCSEYRLLSDIPIKV